MGIPTWHGEPIARKEDTLRTFDVDVNDEAGVAPNFSAMFKVVLEGLQGGQNITNVLWYRKGYFGGIFDWGTGAAEVARTVEEDLWAPTLKSAMSTTYTLQGIRVTPYDSAFAQVLSMPHYREVNEAGTASGSVAGPAACLIARFNVEAISILNGFVPPKRGYLAVGPYREADVDDNGRLTTTAQTFWTDKCGVFAVNLTPGVIGEIWPCRVKLIKLPFLPPVLAGFADVESMSVNAVAAFRRSRLPEA